MIYINILCYKIIAVIKKIIIFYVLSISISLLLIAIISHTRYSVKKSEHEIVGKRGFLVEKLDFDKDISYFNEDEKVQIQIIKAEKDFFTELKDNECIVETLKKIFVE